jgi:hypothetical protein
MYYSQKLYIKHYKFVDNRLCNCTTANMYAYHAHNTHCTSICDKILVTHASNRP